MPTHHKGSPGQTRALNAYIKLMRASESVQSQLDQHLGAHNLTESQFGVLEVLYHLGAMYQNELGAKLFTSKGNVTHVLDNLEKRDLVRRQRNPNDRRQVLVDLTATGRETVKAVLPDHVARIVTLFSSLSAKEQDTLGALCKKLGLSIREQP